jgi:ABC-type lipopolysaccharide export system ATPase subunit
MSRTISGPYSRWSSPTASGRERDLDGLLDEFGIARLRKTPTIALSGGERRRVEIARALATRPNYMLLDEPFAGIDPIAVGDIQQLVKHLTYRGIGVLITDHNVRETLGLTDRGLYFLFRRGADGGPHRRYRQQSRSAPTVSGRGIPPLKLSDR